MMVPLDLTQEQETHPRSIPTSYSQDEGRLWGAEGTLKKDKEGTNEKILKRQNGKKWGVEQGEWDK